MRAYGATGASVPDFATHYYRMSRRPFLNLSDLSDAEALETMHNLTAERREGKQNRLFGQTYLRMRRLAEARLRQAFEARGGRPTRMAPHYFVLGRSAWFRGLATDMAEVQLPLVALPADQTTVTWGDSFAAMEVGPEFGLPLEDQPYLRRQVFLLEELPRLAETYGIPTAARSERYDGYERRGDGRFVEIQLWSDAPLGEHLEGLEEGRRDLTPGAG